MKTLFFLILLFHTTFTAQASNQALRDLLLACFDETTLQTHGPPRKARFKVAAIDDYRDVEVWFLIRKLNDQCVLRWIDSVDQDSEPNEGSMRSVRVDNGEKVHGYYGARHKEIMPTKIELVIHGGKRKNPYIEIASLHPDNQCSGKFVRSLVVQISNLHNELFGGNMFTYLDFDSSENRELFWLVKAEGKTYYEQAWNLVYDCMIINGAMGLLELWTHSRNADNGMALSAFQYVKNINFLPEQGANFEEDEDNIFILEVEFREEVLAYYNSKSFEELQTMTIRQALNEFIPRWSESDRYTNYYKQILAQNTFIYFFRNYQHWNQIARQVLSNYDWDCNSMRGYPEDSTPRQFQFQFARNGGSSGAGPSEQSETPPSRSPTTSTAVQDQSSSIVSRQSSSRKRPVSDGDSITSHGKSDKSSGKQRKEERVETLNKISVQTFYIFTSSIFFIILIIMIFNIRLFDILFRSVSLHNSDMYMEL